jgi:hypothetical protein
VRFYSSFFTFFYYHSIIDKASARFFFNCKLKLEFPYINGFSRILRFLQKLTVSLCVFGKTASFCYTFLPKMRNSASSLNKQFTAETIQFHSAFSLIMITVTRHFAKKKKLGFTLRFH